MILLRTCSVRIPAYRSKCLIPNAPKFGGPKWDVFGDLYHTFSRRARFRGILVPNLKKNLIFFVSAYTGICFTITQCYLGEVQAAGVRQTIRRWKHQPVSSF